MESKIKVSLDGHDFEISEGLVVRICEIVITQPALFNRGLMCSIGSSVLKLNGSEYRISPRNREIIGSLIAQEVLRPLPSREIPEFLDYCIKFFGQKPQKPQKAKEPIAPEPVKNKLDLSIFARGKFFTIVGTALDSTSTKIRPSRIVYLSAGQVSTQAFSNKFRIEIMASYDASCGPETRSIRVGGHGIMCILYDPNEDAELRPSTPAEIESFEKELLYERGLFLDPKFKTLEPVLVLKNSSLPDDRPTETVKASKWVPKEGEVYWTFVKSYSRICVMHRRRESKVLDGYLVLAGLCYPTLEKALAFLKKENSENYIIEALKAVGLY